MENEQELQDSLTLDEQPLEELAKVESVQGDVISRAEYDKLAESRSKIYARAKAAEEKLKEIKKEKPVEKEVHTSTVVDEVEAVLQLKANGFSDAEVLEARRYAKRTNQPLPDVTKDPILSAYIEKNREKKNVEQATPSPSGRTSTQATSDYASAKNEAERRAAFEKMVTMGKTSNE